MAMKTPLSVQRTCGQCIRQRYLHPNRTTATRYLSTSNLLRSAPKANPLRTTGNARAARPNEQDVAKYRRSMIISASGIAACAVAMYGVITLDAFGLEATQAKETDGKDEVKDNAPSGIKLEGPEGFPHSPSVIRIQGQDGAEEVATGTSTIPTFPSTIRLPRYQQSSATLAPGDEIPVATGAEDEDEYQLLGLGVRTVSFLKIQVYVVGLYVAKSDISELQRRLIETAVHPPTDDQVIANPVGATSATSLVSTERQLLKQLLLDEEKGEDAWNAIIKDNGLRTAFRIVPTRNTDFIHLRDGWVRGITARAQKANAKAKVNAEGQPVSTPGEFEDESFGAAMSDFKKLFGGGQRKNVPKGQTLLLLRNERGELDVLFGADPEKPWRFMGRVSDERVSRLVWLNYLAGKNVSSEDARKSVVDGVMGVVERPVGTLVQKVL
ncbi:chalcone-flavanone isomerase-domain-containing protein [Aspergillus pseudodeflectus]|uniref:Chalcone-flavanone isomerase-domain-containing protein n=1 Tax=Aspergillus pseudodeflectus TaxID=176178 RepID=A0ABR4KTI6_9EURO